MLIFARRKGQRIVVGNEIEIVITHTSRTSVKIGIRAPAHCSVLRGEVFDQIAEANRAAAAAVPLEADTDDPMELAPGDGAPTP
ncbi:MAG TPA: carbon storage regulator [Polyangiaceae bacterium]|nr:carbon storage regulator [Polyangiaceae bacterium]